MSKPRNFKSGYPYHITARGNQKEDIFLQDKDYKYFQKILHKYMAIYNIPIFEYCLMPNHYHLLLYNVQEGYLSKAMHRVNCTYAFHMRKKYKWVGHIFQSRFGAWRINSVIYFSTVVEYIKMNPVKCGLANSFEEYPWKYIDEKLIRKMTQVYEIMS